MRHSIRELADTAISAIEEPPTQAMTATIAKDVARAFSIFTKYNKKLSQIAKLEKGEITIKSLEEFKFTINNGTKDDTQFDHQNSSTTQTKINDIINNTKNQITQLVIQHHKDTLEKETKENLLNSLEEIVLNVIHLGYVECEAYIKNTFITTHTYSLDFKKALDITLKLLITTIDENKCCDLIHNLNQTATTAGNKTLIKLINVSETMVTHLNNNCEIFQLLSDGIRNKTTVTEDINGVIAVEENLFKHNTSPLAILLSNNNNFKLDEESYNFFIIECCILRTIKILHAAFFSTNYLMCQQNNKQEMENKINNIIKTKVHQQKQDLVDTVMLNKDNTTLINELIDKKLRPINRKLNNLPTNANVQKNLPGAPKGAEAEDIVHVERLGESRKKTRKKTSQHQQKIPFKKVTFAKQS